jgi:glycosyltransferase involved in cell wall biosynthesis
MSSNPLVSIILPVYNAEKFLAESIRSILNQTYSNIELIILNDGSTDSSTIIVKSFTDQRIRYYEHANMGLANTLNKGIALANGKYIARQDNDDISYPTRLELQVAFMEKNPEYALLGTHARIVDENGNDTGRRHLHPTKSSHLTFDLIFDNPFVHSSVLLNKELLSNVGTYDPSSDFFEDHHLWSSISRKYKVANLPVLLLDYREVGTGMSKSTKTYSDRVLTQTRINLLHYGVFSEDEINRIARVYHSGYNDITEKEMLMNAATKLIDLIFETENEKEKKMGFNRFLLKMELRRIRNAFNNSDASGLKLLRMKLKRRWIFHRFNQLNSCHQF